ncbi:MAG: hypothetical protein AB7F99_13625, partial [Vicinamibacterales bacterium]
NQTVFVSLIGLAILALGARIGMGNRRGASTENAAIGERGVTVLFWIVMAVFAVDYLYVLNPQRYSGAALIDKVLQFRYVLLIALWSAILLHPGRWVYLFVSFVWVMIPAFGGYFSNFKTPIFMLLLVVAARWELWDGRWWHRHAAKTLVLVPVVCALLGLAVLWQGAVKLEARERQDESYIEQTPLDRVAFFIESATTNLPAILNDTSEAVGELVARLSYVTLFSLVLDHTPSVEPYADGELLRGALLNGTVPRFIFPDKPVLPSASEYTRRFTGERVGGDLDGTASISIGYMAEFYADWGMTGMFVSVFSYGVWMGLLHLGIRRFIASPWFVDGSLIIVLFPAMSFEHQFVKAIGALNIGFIVTLMGAAVLTPTLRRMLQPVELPVRDWSGAPERSAPHA